jgi:hypothetical protein
MCSSCMWMRFKRSHNGTLPSQYVSEHTTRPNGSVWFRIKQCSSLIRFYRNGLYGIPQVPVWNIKLWSPLNFIWIPRQIVTTALINYRSLYNGNKALEEKTCSLVRQYEGPPYTQQTYGNQKYCECANFILDSEQNCYSSRYHGDVRFRISDEFPLWLLLFTPIFSRPKNAYRFCIEINNKTRTCNRIYYSNVS